MTSARNRAECLKSVKTGGFDLYLLNHTFPDASGIGLWMAIRETDAETPVSSTWIKAKK